MAKFRKKPVVIEAEQWFPNLNKAHVYAGCPRWDCGVFCSSEMYIAKKHIKTKGYLKFYIDTLEGLHEVSSGDWIITGVKGEKYPCKPDVFELTYEKVD